MASTCALGKDGVSRITGDSNQVPKILLESNDHFHIYRLPEIHSGTFFNRSEIQRDWHSENHRTIT